MKVSIQLKRAYESASASDGRRLLVERLWPRGVSKEKAAIDDWLRELAPSTELRKWFDHDPTRWDEFQLRYFRELDDAPEAVARLLDHVRSGTVTFVFGSREQRYNNAVALKRYVETRAAAG